MVCPTWIYRSDAGKRIHTGVRRLSSGRNGDVIERDYAVGDACEREDYYMDGCCVEASSVITEWMDGEISRKDVVDEVQRLFTKWEEKEKYFRELENL